MAVSRSASIVNSKVRMAIACMGVTYADGVTKVHMGHVGVTAEQKPELILHHALDQNFLTAICRSVRPPQPEAASVHPGDTLLQLHSAVTA